MSDRPNVLFVLSDQMRAHAMGCMGNDQVRTPTLDQLASDGVLCTRTYSPDPVCTPARGSILTGQYPHSHRTLANNFRLPTTEPTIADALGDAGYRTGYIGKWHLDGSPKPGYIPPERRQGFEHWEGFNRGHAHLTGHPRVDEDGSVTWEEGYQPAVQTDMAIDFIADQATGDDPFFCFLSWGPPHLPYEAPEEYEAMYDAADLELRPNVPDRMAAQARRDLVPYYGMVTSLDDQMDRLLAALDEHGVADDTIVVFTSDHGELIGSQGEYYKGKPWEESVQVPLIWRCPEALPDGEVCDELVSLVDLTPTILSLCDVEIPETVQGTDVSGALDGSVTVDRDGVYIQHGLGRDDEWRALRTDEHLLVVDGNGEPQHFYNTADDPFQRHNLVDLIHDKSSVERALVDAAIEYDDRHFLSSIGERPS